MTKSKYNLLSISSNSLYTRVKGIIESKHKDKDSIKKKEQSVDSISIAQVRSSSEIKIISNMNIDGTVES